MQVSTGEYRLSALPVDSEGSSNLLFSPGYIDVNVKCPLLDVEFSQVNEYFFTVVIFQHYLTFIKLMDTLT